MYSSRWSGFVLPVLALLACLAHECAGHEHAPKIDRSIATSTSPGNRFDVVVPGNTGVLVYATSQDPDDEWYRAVRYDRLAGATVRETGSRDKRGEPLELPPVPGRTYLYVDAIHRPPGADASADKKSKLRWKFFGDGTWRLTFTDGHNSGRRDALVLTVRFTKPDKALAAHQSPRRPATRPGPEAAAPPARVPAAAAAGPGAASAAPAAIDWSKATQSAQVGDVRVKVASAIVGPVPLVNADGDAGSSDVPLIAIKLTVENLSPTKRVEFRTWSGLFSSAGAFAAATDDNGNVYKRMTFGATDRPFGATPTATILPGQSISDVVVFEPPIDDIQFLHLEVPAKNVSADAGGLRLRIPANMIQK